MGRLFADKLDLPYTEDIPTLTNAARKALREVFLGADIGVSGVNFGVAETGTLCVVTNEGNGRMCTTLPRVHVALMGIERLVPTSRRSGAVPVAAAALGNRAETERLYEPDQWSTPGDGIGGRAEAASDPGG